MSQIQDGCKTGVTRTHGQADGAVELGAFAPDELPVASKITAIMI
jgi:hypothetical protein